MQVLFAGGRHVHYGQVYVQSGVEPPQADLGEAFAGQVNGLCGAATPGWLIMVTGLHTGHVGFTVERHDTVPPVDDAWEEIVEVSFRPTAEPVLLVQWAGEASWPLDIEPVDLRARYCAWGMDQARQADTILAGEPELDRYLLQFWPAPAAPDQVLKQTGATAAHWHGYARGLPPPPSAEEKARLAEQAEREEQARRWQFEVDLMWGGLPPTERLRTVGGTPDVAAGSRPAHPVRRGGTRSTARRDRHRLRCRHHLRRRVPAATASAPGHLPSSRRRERRPVERPPQKSCRSCRESGLCSVPG